MAAPASDASLQERDDYDGKVRFFNNFLHQNRDEWAKRISTELANKRNRIPVELRDLEEAEAGLSNKVLEAPVKYLLPWNDALLAFLRDIDEKATRSLKQPLQLDIGGAFGRNHTTPRGMTSTTLGNMVRVEGIVIKAGLRTPKLLTSMHVRKDQGDGSDHVEARDHRDQTAFVTSSASGAMPTQDSEGNELAMEIGLSVYKDYQKFHIQEAPENAPPGQIPRNIEVVCEGDLADRAKPGDRVQVSGVYKSFPPPATDFTTGVFPSRLIATNITPIKEITEVPFVSADVSNIKAIAARPDAFQLLSRSFAPSICGHEWPKAGMLLQMIGGTEKNLANGTHLRGDINVLLVGDPSCGKSQMLRFVMNISQLAISTTGRGSSGAGLTAACVRDPGARDFSIEAGAMVLADRGVICIDEFDKMSQTDRVAIHEAMEQQVVTIAKAGMHVTLNARCSVVAAANPVYGSIDPTMDLAKNIGLPDSLLSRFDLVFIIRDVTTEEVDRKIATQVVRQAQQRLGAEGRRRGVEEIHSTILQRRQETDARKTTEPTQVFAHAVASTGAGEGGEQTEVLTIDFLRKYLRYCRRFAPVLSDEAQIEISERYVEMRMRFQSGFAETSNTESKKPRLAVTTRTLEGLIRLSTAHAKLKLRKDFVLKEDVVEAYKLMLRAREEEMPAVPAVAAPEAEADAEAPAERRTRRKRPRQEVEEEEPASPTIQRARVDSLRGLVARTFARAAVQQLQESELLEAVNAGIVQGEPAFVAEEFHAGLRSLERENKIMLLEDTGDVIIIG